MLFVILPLQTYGFATYLLSNMGCMTDLSTDEVIMNSQVVAAVDSDHKNVRLVLVSEDQLQQQEQMGDGSTRLFLKPAEGPRRLDLKLEAEGVHDVQFVVETTEGGQMEHGQCDSMKRVAARGKDVVTLELLNDNSISEPVTVWAGWATGHEAVRLTPVLEFHLEEANRAKTEQKHKQEEEEELKEKLKAYESDLARVEKKDKLQESKRRSHRSDSDHRRAHQRRQHHARQREAWEMRAESGSDSGDVVSGEVSRRESRSSSRRKKASTSRKSRPDRPHHHTVGEVARQRSITEKIHEKFLKHRHHGKHKETGIELDTTWFFYGLGVLLLGNFIVVQCCMLASGGGEKTLRMHSQ